MNAKDMSWEMFVNTVKAMREAQKSYFKTKSYGSLMRAKELEKEVDSRIKGLLVVAEEEQPTLEF